MRDEENIFCNAFHIRVKFDAVMIMKLFVDRTVDEVRNVRSHSMLDLLNFNLRVRTVK